MLLKQNCLKNKTAYIKSKPPCRTETASSKGEMREQTQNPPTLHTHAHEGEWKIPQKREISVARGGSAITSCRHAAWIIHPRRAGPN
jgi:hypothetical protein